MISWGGGHKGGLGAFAPPPPACMLKKALILIEIAVYCMYVSYTVMCVFV